MTQNDATIGAIGALFAGECLLKEDDSIRACAELLALMHERLVIPECWQVRVQQALAAADLLKVKL